MRPQAKPLLLACFSLGFGLAMIEAGLRILGLRHATAPMRPHPVLHHVHQRDIRFRSFEASGEVGSHPVWFDGGGFVSAPDAPPAMRWDAGAATRVLFMGDSFTEAVQVPFAESFVGRLAARAAPGTCLANAGVASYSPVLHRLQWREQGRGLNPTHVVLQLFGNDVRDDAGYAASASSVDAQGLPLAVPGPKERWYTPIWRASYLGYELRRLARILDYKRKAANQGPIVEAGAVMEENPEITPLTHRALLALRDEIAAGGAELWIMPVTSRANALDEPGTFGSHVRAWCGTNAVRVVDLRPAFADPKALFFTRDIHWNAAGHEKVAEILSLALPGFQAGN